MSVNWFIYWWGILGSHAGEIEGHPLGEHCVLGWQAGGTFEALYEKGTVRHGTNCFII